MKRIIGITAAALALVAAAVLAPAASAASIRLVSSTTFTDPTTGLSLTATGGLLGLAPGSTATVKLQASGLATAVCVENSGRIVPAGRLVSITGTGSTTVIGSQAKNAASLFTVGVSSITHETSPFAAGCPRPYSTTQVKVTSADYNGATLSVFQNGVLVTGETFTGI